MSILFFSKPVSKILIHIVALLTLATAQPVAAQKARVDLYIGKVQVLNESNVKRMAIGNGKVISAVVLDNKQVLVLPEIAGQSDLHLWKKDGSEVIYSFAVFASDSARTLADIRSLLGEGSNISVKMVGDNIVLEGTNVSTEEASKVAELTKRYPQIINLVGKLGLEKMVYIDVKIVEFKKNAFKNLGVKWSTSAPGFTYGIIGDSKRSDLLEGANPNAAAPPNVQIRPRIPPFASYFGLATSFTSVLNLAQANGDATILAEPKLTSKSGGQAKFLAGGEVPIPIVSALGQSNITFKPYGVRLEITPTVSGSGIISTKVLAELSAVDLANAVQGVPAFAIRRAETEVNLRQYETLVLSGLVNEDFAKAIDKVPLLGDIPILGALFKSTEFRSNKTELVIFLTPRFIAADTDVNQTLIDSAQKRVVNNRANLAE